MAMEQDLELMLRVRAGDAPSFDALLRRYRLPLVSYFHRMLGDRALAEDLAQEAFLRVFKARLRYRPEAKFTTWLYRIATNLALNALRDRKAAEAVDEQAVREEVRPSPFVDLKPSAEQQLIESDRQRVVRQAIGTLPANQRAALILHKYQEIEYRQIARILGVSVSAVKSLLFRAHESLRVRLEPLLRGGQL